MKNMIFSNYLTIALHFTAIPNCHFPTYKPLPITIRPITPPIAMSSPEIPRNPGDIREMEGNAAGAAKKWNAADARIDRCMYT